MKLHLVPRNKRNYSLILLEALCLVRNKEKRKIFVSAEN
jgi:hypothetical protein